MSWQACTRGSIGSFHRCVVPCRIQGTRVRSVWDCMEGTLDRGGERDARGRQSCPVLRVRGPPATLPSSPRVWMHRAVSHPLPCNQRLHGVGLDGHEFSPLSPWTVACVRLTLYGQGSEHPSIPLIQPLAWDAHSTFFFFPRDGQVPMTFFLGSVPRTSSHGPFPFCSGLRSVSNREPSF